MHLLDMVHQNSVEWDEEIANVLYGCTGCQLCKANCRHDNDVSSALWQGRALAVERGLAHPSLNDFPRQFHKRNRDLAATLRATTSPGTLKRTGDTGYFPGCDTIESGPTLVDAALALLRTVTSTSIPIIAPPATCAGYPLWAAGYHQAARFWAQEFVERIRNFATIVTDCAACTHLLRVVYPSIGYDHNTRILTSVEFLLERQSALKIVRKLSPVFYHDPCYLGRYLGVYDQPRRLLAPCSEQVREFYHAREQSLCCGGGGLVPTTYPEVAEKQARSRLAEAKIFDTYLVATACSTCKKTFTKAQTDVTVFHVLEALAWAAELTDELSFPSTS